MLVLLRDTQVTEICGTTWQRSATSGIGVHDVAFSTRGGLASCLASHGRLTGRLFLAGRCNCWGGLNLPRWLREDLLQIVEESLGEITVELLSYVKAANTRAQCVLKKDGERPIPGRQVNQQVA